jgi:hypothetical protein
MPRPVPGTYPPYFDKYISLVETDDLMQAFEEQGKKLAGFFESIDENLTDKGYAEGKWSLKDLLQHLIDCERIFNFRSLCFARGEKQSLPGFDEDPYASMAHANSRNWKSLCDEYLALRKSTKMMYESFDGNDLVREGMSNNKTSTALAFGFTTIGHVYHHVQIIRERYLG